MRFDGVHGHSGDRPHGPRLYVAVLSVRWLARPADRILHHRLFGRSADHLLSNALTSMSWGLVLWGVGLGFVARSIRLPRDRLDRDLRRGL